MRKNAEKIDVTSKAALYLPFSLLSRLVLFKAKKCPAATVIITTLFKEVMEITKTAKTLNLAKKRILPNLPKK